MEWLGPTGSCHLHGTLRLQSSDNKFNKFDTPSTAGFFAKVPAKPTNHSKFTGKCGEPRCTGRPRHPSCKSKGKTKGSYMVKSNERDMDWGVVYGEGKFEFAGFSATEMLDHLVAEYEKFS